MGTCNQMILVGMTCFLMIWLIGKNIQGILISFQFCGVCSAYVSLNHSEHFPLAFSFSKWKFLVTQTAKLKSSVTVFSASSKNTEHIYTSYGGWNLMSTLNPGQIVLTPTESDRQLMLLKVILLAKKSQNNKMDQFMECCQSICFRFFTL